MKLLASFLSLTLVAALSTWLWFSQDTSDVVAQGVDLTSASSTAQPGGTGSLPVEGGSLEAQVEGMPGLTDRHAAAFVGLQTLLDVWQNQPRSVLSDTDLLAQAVQEARASSEAEVAAAQQAAAEEKARQEAAAEEKARQEAAAKPAPAPAPAPSPEPPRQVSPPPVSGPPAPPNGDCEYEDGAYDCDDDGDDDWKGAVWDCELDDGEWECEWDD